MELRQRSLIITTCGHIDHGKTALVRALTGTDADRLPEEKRRGLTIELGYAQLTLSEDLIAGFVDVPGHEKLLRNMLAGCCGTDIALLVIDVNEGMRQQTLEHLAVMNALKIPGTAVVFSKCATAEAELLKMRFDQLAEQVLGTIFEQAPIYCVDSIAGSGLDELRSGLIEIAATVPLKKTTAAVKMWVDRVFSKQGIGTIVTGSLLAGTIRVGDRLRLLPQKEFVRVRAIQMFGVSSDSVNAGMRVALNITGAARTTISRETLLSGCDRISVDNQCWLQAFANIRTGAVRGYLGTMELTGRIKRVRNLGEEQWLFICKGQFPIEEGASILFRELNSRTIAGVAAIVPPFHHRARSAAAVITNKKMPTEISVGNVRYCPEQVEKYISILRTHFARYPTITLAQFRDSAELNREQAKQILEHFDTQKLMIRSGNDRCALKKLFDYNQDIVHDFRQSTKHKMKEVVKMKKLIVITGASSGIGEAAARLFSELGHPILLLARRVERLEALNLPDTICIKTDVVDAAAIKAAVASAEEKYGAVDCFINNAGVMLLGAVDTQSPAEWKQMFDVNVLGVLNGIQAVLSKMIANQYQLDCGAKNISQSRGVLRH